MDLISVIVPVYNVEKYLSRCIESIMNQTYFQLEIILVNDGSSDSSGRLCDSYKQQDARIIVVHKNNGGLSDARNSGIDIARGNYILFVDSDDYIATNCVERLHNLIREYKADIAMCGHKNFYDEVDIGLQEAEEIVEYTNMEALTEMLYQKNVYQSAWGKIYKAELFSKIRYPVGYLYEDLLCTYSLFLESKTIVQNKSQLYYYFQRSDSIMKRKFDIRNMDRIKLSENILQDIKRNHHILEKAGISRVFISSVQVLREIPLKSNEFKIEYKKMKSNIQKYRKVVLFDKKAKKINRIIAGACYLPLGLVQRFGCIYKWIFA